MRERYFHRASSVRRSWNVRLAERACDDVTFARSSRSSSTAANPVCPCVSSSQHPIRQQIALLSSAVVDAFCSVSKLIILEEVSTSRGDSQSLVKPWQLRLFNASSFVWILWILLVLLCPSQTDFASSLGLCRRSIGLVVNECARILSTIDLTLLFCLCCSQCRVIESRFRTT